jgi:phosphotriesterase-related protein
MSGVMTVLGYIRTDKLGVTLMHEHLLSNLMQITLNPDHIICDVRLVIKELGYFQAAGGATLVDVTSRGLGRNPTALRQIARDTGLHIVMGCGWYRERTYDQGVFQKGPSRIADEMVRDITQGVDDTDVRAGIIGEIGTELDYISPAEERVFRASARAHKRTGVAISTHAVRSPVGLAQLDLLEEEGVNLRRVIVGHCDNAGFKVCPDPDYHEAVARRGAYVEFDQIHGRSGWDTERRVEWVKQLVDKGYLRQILLSQDVCAKSLLRAYGGNGYDYLLSGFVPRLLKAGLSEEQVHVILVENPRRALTPAL